MQRTGSILASYPSHLRASSELIKEENLDDPRYHVNDWTLKYIPQQIVFYIFTKLGRGDLTAVAQVCRIWRQVAKDPYFGWIPLCKIQLREPEKWAAVDEWMEDPILFDEIKFEDHELPYFDSMKTYRHPMLYYKGEKLGFSRSVSTGLGMTMEIFESMLSNPEVFRWHQYDESGVKIHIEVNVKKLEEKFGDPNFPPLSVVFERIEQEQTKRTQRVSSSFIDKSQSGNIMEPNKPALRKEASIVKQPKNLKLKLHEYQLEALRWMKSLEDDIDNGLSYNYTTLCPWIKAKTQFLFYLYYPKEENPCLETANSKVVPFNDIPKFTYKVHPKGGILADEMGLGKTTTVISLILANPYKNDDPKEKSEKSEKSENSESSKNPETFQVEYENEIFKLQIPSKATLIVCPNHLVSQWFSEIQEHVEISLKIIKITTIKEYRACSWKDFMDADVVIVSFQFFKNPKYFIVNCTEADATVATMFANRPEWVLSSLEQVTNPLKTKISPLLEHFNWNRVVLDEAHELMEQEYYSYVLPQLNGRKKWYVSGTPVTNEATLKGALEYLGFPFWREGDSSKLCFLDLLKNNLFWRNTKATVNKEYSVAPTIEEVILLEFTDIEKTIYKYLKEKAEYHTYLCRRRANVDAKTSRNCMNEMTLKSKETLENLKQTEISATESEISWYHEGIKSWNEIIEGKKQKMNDPDFNMDEYQESLKTCTKMITRMEKELLQVEIKLKEFKQTMTPEQRLEKVLENSKKMHRTPSMRFQDEKVPEDPTDEEKMDSTPPFEFQDENQVEKSDKKENSKKREREEKSQLENQVEDQVEDEDEDESEEEIPKKKTKTKKSQVEKRVTRSSKKIQVEDQLESESEDEDVPKRKTRGNSKKKKVQVESDDESEEEEIPKKKTRRNSRKKAESESDEESGDENSQVEDEIEIPTEKEVKKMTVAVLKENMDRLNIDYEKNMRKPALMEALLSWIEENENSAEKSGKSTNKAEKSDKKSKKNAKSKENSKKKEPVRRSTRKVAEKSKKSGFFEESSSTDDEQDIIADMMLEPISEEEKIKELWELVEKLGTKMGNMIVYLRNLWRDDPLKRCIIFSQSDEVLDMLIELLAKYGIQSVFLKGNVMKKNKVLKAFKEPDSEVRVMMLGLDKSASGTNLIEASHVILVDPVKGTKEEAQAIDGQAIGRAYRQGQKSQVTVVRFLIKDTHEHESYLSTYCDDFVEKQDEKGKDVMEQALESINNDMTRQKSMTMFRANSIMTVLANSPNTSVSMARRLIDDASTTSSMDAPLNESNESSDAKEI